jgi:hypothetical protein
MWWGEEGNEKKGLAAKKKAETSISCLESLKIFHTMEKVGTRKFSSHL